ncbi:hypothetical protein LEP1GSC188_3878 [Leptospira weilii serovar Topaz str. LT2116]|uniref:Uncharacterized protein n=1 Tax=Leptospira weilii serovar Topaz str. LT2116 TaxID=1088540 RepID=M3EI18_9LEPT|nr:hypothetical protein LEP1GSC188_3878 [Leptospira weilii serovar Topaz str. LT2116]
MDGFEQNGEILHSEIEYTKTGYFIENILGRCRILGIRC